MYTGRTPSAWRSLRTSDSLRFVSVAICLSEKPLRFHDRISFSLAYVPISRSCTTIFRISRRNQGSMFESA